MMKTKKPRERTSKKKFKSLDEKYMGLEPTWEDVDVAMKAVPKFIENLRKTGS